MDVNRHHRWGGRFIGMTLALAAAWSGVADTNLWPARAKSKSIGISSVVGAPPKDFGRFGRCRILGLGGQVGGRSDFLVVTEHLQPRNNPQHVPVEHPGGRFNLPMSRYNGSRASFQAARAAKPRGLFIYLTGIIGLTPPEEKLVATFRAAGWHTLVSETSFNFMRRRYELITPATLRPVAERLGRDINEHLADKAYAVEAMLEFLTRRWPELSKGHRIVAGGSAGSIAVPAVVAKIGRPDAVILVGAGGNAARIVSESSLAPLTLYRHEGAGANRIRVRLSKAELLAVQKVMYAATRLDPLRLAKRLQGIPTLMLRAELDQIVPVATNDLLFEALGRPERWSLPVNHIMLFGALHLQSGMILGWTEKNIGAADKP